MKLLQANMQTGILVLLVVLVAIVCVALFFTNKEVRNIKASVVKSRHDITAIQTLLSDVGFTASGGMQDTGEFVNPMNELPPTHLSEMPNEMLPNNSTESNNTPEPLTSDTTVQPADVNLNNSNNEDVIPAEDVEVVKNTNSQNNGSENNVKQNESESESESDSESDSESESESEKDTK